MPSECMNVIRKQFYEEMGRIKDDTEFMLATGLYEYDGELGMIPVILPEDPDYIRKRKLSIYHKKVKSFRKKHPELFTATCKTK